MATLHKDQQPQLSKVTKMNIDADFHYKPKIRSYLNPSNKMMIKLNQNHHKILNYFSYEQQNNNTTTTHIPIISKEKSNMNKTLMDFHNNTTTRNSKELITKTTEGNTKNISPSKENGNMALTHSNFNLKNKRMKMKLFNCNSEPNTGFVFKPSTKRKPNQATVQILFNSFLEKLKENYPDLYTEFYSYTLLSSTNCEIGQSEKDTTKLFKSLFEKFYTKSSLSKDNLTANTLFLSTIESLLFDYYYYISKAKSSFLQSYFECYKEIVVLNYGILGKEVKDKSIGVIQQEEDIKKLIDEIDSLKLQIIDNQSQSNITQYQIEKNESIIQQQKDEIQSLKDELEQLKDTIQIKDYKINELSKKNEEQLKDGLVSGMITKHNENDDKLDLEKLLKSRIERVKFNKFKKDVINKKKKPTKNDLVKSPQKKRQQPIIDNESENDDSSV